MSDTARLVSMFARATLAQRVLQLGAVDAATVLTIAEALTSEGLLIAVEPQQTTADAARQAVASRGFTQRVTVIAADPSRYLHKLAGPFDIVFQSRRPSSDKGLHDRLVRLLSASGTLITDHLSSTPDYNRVLIADKRLATMTMAVGSGLAISVRRPEVIEPQTRQTT